MKKKRLTLVDEARYLAISLHGLQKYDEHPYYYHLEEVVEVLKDHGFTEDKYICAGYLHDAFEDTAISYNDLMKIFGKEIADIVYDVTDELGKNRKERKEKTYPKIRANKDAIIVKLADRIANVTNAKKTGNPIFEMYQKEYTEFRSALDTNDYTLDSLWIELDNIMFEFKNVPY